MPAAAQFADALALAWQRHPQAAASSARESESLAQVHAADRLVPGAATVAIAYTGSRPGAPAAQREWEIEVSTPLWLPDQRASRRGESEAVSAERAAGLAALRWELAGELREAGWALAAARLTTGLTERRAGTAAALVDDVLRRYRAGELSRIDANLARSERIAAEAEVREATLAQRAAEQAWQRLTGRPPPDRFETEPVDSAAGAAPSAGGGALPEGHPRLAAAAAQWRLARARLAIAERYAREQPELALRALRERRDLTEPYSTLVGVRLKIPLEFGPRVRQEGAAAQAEYQRAVTELERLREKLAIELDRAAMESDTARRQLAASTERRALADDNLELAARLFAHGESDLATLLRARAAAFDAEGLHQRLQVQFSLAASRLRQARGELP